MFKIHKEEIDFGGKKLVLETGKVARQADGAIIAKLGETVVIATVVGAKKLNEGQDYFPLSVNYQEKYYAAGKIPGGYFKREARPTEAETLISRLIDRPIRPLFPSSFIFLPLTSISSLYILNIISLNLIVLILLNMSPGFFFSNNLKVFFFY